MGPPKSSPAAPARSAADKNELTNKILHEIYGLYTNPGSVDRSAKFGTVGLEAISKDARLPSALLHPRRRVTVMIVGNHSAGKVRRGEGKGVGLRGGADGVAGGGFAGEVGRRRGLGPRSLACLHARQAAPHASPSPRGCCWPGLRCRFSCLPA